MVFVLPAVFLLLLVVGFPFVYAIWVSLTNNTVGDAHPHFIGLANYGQWITNVTFWLTLLHTLIYDLSTVLLGVVFGLAIGLSLHKINFLRDIWGGAVLLPWIIPTIVAVLIWQWIFNPINGVASYVLQQLHLTNNSINWLGQSRLAFLSVVIVSAWRYVPYFGVVVLAGRRQIDEQLYEASVLDGANEWQQFWNVTLPLLRNVLTLMSVLIFVRVLSDFSGVFVLTRGGPASATQILTVLSFITAFQVGNMASGISAPILVMPLLIPVIVVLTNRMVRNLVGARQ